MGLLTAPVVLVVDDEDELRAEICEALIRSGMTVYSSASPPGGAAILAAHPDITVVMTDIRMAEGDGMVFADSVLVAASGAHAIEVVVLTGFADLDMALEAVRVRIFALLRKPPSLQTVVTTLRNAHAATMVKRAAAECLIKLQSDVLAHSAALEGGLSRQLAIDHRTRLDPMVNLANDGLLNALVPLVGFSELLEGFDSAALAKNGRSFARRIRIGSEKLALLVRGTTTLLAFRSGQEAAKLAPLTVADLVDGLGSAYGLAALDRSVQITSTVKQDKVLSADAELFGNAVRLLLGFYNDTLPTHKLGISFALAEPGGSVECLVGFLEADQSIVAPAIAAPAPGLDRLGLAAWLAGELMGFCGAVVAVNANWRQSVTFSVRLPAWGGGAS